MDGCCVCAWMAILPSRDLHESRLVGSCVLQSQEAGASVDGLCRILLVTIRRTLVKDHELERRKRKLAALDVCKRAPKGRSM